MKKKRIIPIFLLNDMKLVNSRNFEYFETIGNPFLTVKRFSEWMVDELIYLNITRTKTQAQKEKEIKNFIKLIAEVSKSNFIPLTVGGKINNLKQIYNYLRTKKFSK